MKIAVTSQNRRDVTAHAGRCRKFWVFQVDEGRVAGKELLKLPKEQSFHESSPHQRHPLDDVAVLITAGMGEGMSRRLARMGITGIVTDEQSPEKAVEAYLSGELHTPRPGPGCHPDGHGSGDH